MAVISLGFKHDLQGETLDGYEPYGKRTNDNGQYLVGGFDSDLNLRIRLY